MVKHYNPSIVENAQRMLNTKLDNLPSEVSGPVAVIPIEHLATILAVNNRSTTGSSTLYTAPTNADVYITGILVSITADAACDSSQYLVQTSISGTTVRLAQFFKTTLTAFNTQVYLRFTVPIKLDRGSITTLLNSFTVGTSNFGAVLYGYKEEN